MENKRIGIDFDGPYVDTGSLVRAAIKEKYGLEVPPACLYDNVRRSGISEKDFETVLTEICEKEKYLSILKEQQGATEVIRKLSQNNDVNIITARTGNELQFARTYLNKKGLGHLLRKNSENMSKEELSRGLDMYIEDIPERAISLKSVVPNVVLFNTYDNLPVNLSKKELKSLEDVRRISNWNEL